MPCDDGRTPSEWYQDAVRWYLEGHQGCPRCHGRHCVFLTRWVLRTEYHCAACDFSTSHDGRTGRYFVAAGDGRQLADALLSNKEVELSPP